MVFNAFDTYCSAVCVMVRWKRYHVPITAELTNHMEDHADYLIAKGMEPTVAAAHAVAAMGDPYTVGKELDKLHSPWYPRLSRIFAVLAVLLLLISALIRVNTPLPTLKLFADPTQLLESDSATVLAQGRAKGGGALGAYTFSDGAAALYQYGPYEDGSVTYRLALLLPSHTPWFWLDNPDLTWLPCKRDDTASPNTSSGWVDTRGVFRRFSDISFYLEPPFQSSYTIEVGPNGELGYTVTLEGVTMP